MNLIKATACGLTLASLAACSGAGGGIFGNNPGGGNGGYSQCNPGTSVQLARPQAGTYAPGTTSVEIVASGNNNNLYNTYSQWSIVLQSNYTGQQYPGGNLQLVSDSSGPHPYQSDFYYSSQLGGLPSGQTWQVLLEQNNGFCNPYPLQSFST